MNAAAFAECAAQWGRLQAAHSSGGLAADETASWRRVSNRPELRLVLEPPERVRKMPPGLFGAMGTSGLQPTELRAVAHALAVAEPTGAAAQRFISLLRQRVASLPDYEGGEGGVPSALAPPTLAPPPLAPPPLAPPPPVTVISAPPPPPPPPQPPPSTSSEQTTGAAPSDARSALMAAISGGAARLKPVNCELVQPRRGAVRFCDLC